MLGSHSSSWSHADLMPLPPAPDNQVRRKRGKAVRLLLLRLRCLEGAQPCAECFHCTVLFCLSLLSFLLHFSPLCLFRLSSGSLRPSHCLEPVRLLLWLLARSVDGLAPSACVVRCPTRIHHTFFHHVMCLFDTSFSSCIEFASFLASTHSFCVVVSSSPSCPSWASTPLSSLRFS